MDLSPVSILRMVLITAVAMLAISGLSERRVRRRSLGLLCRTVYPLLLGGLVIVIPWLADREFPQWWEQWGTYALPLNTLLGGVALWLPQLGARLSWSGFWEFREPAPASATGADGLTRPRQTRLRVLGYLVMLTGLAAVTVPLLVVRRPDLTPDWVEPNGFLVGVTGMFMILYSGRVLQHARSRQARELLSSPMRHDAWVGSVLWIAAWLCCLAGLVLTFGGMSVMMEPAGRASWETFVALWAMILGGSVFTWGRRIFLRARRHRARLIASHRHLVAGSFVLYLRSFEADEQQKALHETPMPGMQGFLLGFVLSGRSAEEHIADVLAPVGPLVAVGAPGERLPHVGAVRMYLPGSSDEAWQEPVRRLMQRSRLTVLTLGASEGTMWELAEAMRTLPPHRLILFVPALDPDEYERIRHRSPRLPEAPTWLASYRREPVQAVVTFAEDWTPTLTPVAQTRGNPRSNLFTVLAPVLMPAFAALESYEERTGRLSG